MAANHHQAEGGRAMARRGSTVKVEVRSTASPAVAWHQLREELALSDAVHGAIWPGRSGPIHKPQPGSPSLAEVTIDSERYQIRRLSRPVGWAGETTSEVLISVRPDRQGGSRILLEATGWDQMVGSVLGQEAGDLLGWAVDQVLAPISRAATAEAVGDWLTDRLARRPQGGRARRTYKNPQAHWPGFEAILDLLALSPTDRLLEVGCGGGALLHAALTTGCTAIGVDHSPEMIRLSHQQNLKAVGEGRLVLIPGSAEALPLPALWVTAVAMATVFFLLPEPMCALQECRRVLRPRGRLAVFTIPPELRGTPAAPEPMASRAHFFTDQELADLATAAGFSDAVVTRTANGGELLGPHR